MKNILAKSIISSVFFLAFAQPVIACRNIAPDREPLEKYSSVFLGVTTGVHLAAYERRLLKGDPEIWNGYEEVTLNVVVSKQFLGKSAASTKVRMAGCTYSHPSLKQNSIFFVYKGTDTAVIVSDTDTKLYNFWLKKLRPEPTAQ
jgi:hypothetical protein